MSRQRVFLALTALAFAANSNADSSDICFQLPRTYLLQGANGIVAADFDGDGNLDVATANNFSTVSVLLGDGQGSFGSPIHSPTTVGADVLVVADFDRDGRPDIAVGGGGGIDILLNTSGGAFARATTLGSGRHFRALAKGDFNGDGLVDIAGIDDNAGQVLVFHGEGTGSFVPGPTLPTGPSPFSIAVGDLDADGRDDIVITAAGGLLSFRSLGAGVFAKPRSFGAGVFAGPVALADFTADRKLDAIVGGYGSETFLAPGDGTGGFAAAQRTALPAAAGVFAVGDMNGDGRPDAVVADSALSILLAGPGGKLEVSSRYLGAGPLATGDFNHDGNLDVVAANNIWVSLFLGDGKGRVAGALPVAVSSGLEPSQVIAADLDGDGIPDLVTVGAVFLATGKGTFGAGIPFSDFSGSEKGPAPMAVADVDGDGKLDLVLGTAAVPGFATYLGDGAGHFSDPKPHAVGQGATAPAFGDFNGDGRPDLALVVGPVAIELNVGGGEFSDAPVPPVTSAEALAIADFNGDGKSDLAVANVGTTFQILLGKGNGEFEDPRTFDVLPGVAFSVVAADFDGDGRVDLAFACTYANAVVTMLSDGKGGFGPPAVHMLRERLDVNSGGPAALAVGDFDGDGHPDLAAGDPILLTILRGDGAGGFQITDHRTEATSVAVADFDGDEREDVATGTRFGSGIGVAFNVRPLITPPRLPDGTLGFSYPPTVVAASGGLFPVTVGLAGALPPGLLLGPPPPSAPGAATIIGTPTQPGVFHFELTAQNLDGCLTVKDYTIFVSPPREEIIPPSRRNRRSVARSVAFEDR